MSLRFIAFFDDYFHGCLPWLADSDEAQEIWRKRECDDICQRFMAWFKLSTSQWHGMHLRPRCKQYVPDSYHLTDGVNHPLWKIHKLQLASLHNEGISNHVHHVELYQPKSNSTGKQLQIAAFSLTNSLPNPSMKNVWSLLFSYLQSVGNNKTNIH